MHLITIFEKFEYHHELNPKFWEANEHLIPRYRNKLLQIAYDVIKANDFLTESNVVDIILTGSLANYNYNPLSDFDLHIVYNPADFENIELIQSYLYDEKIIWNIEHNISFQGHDVELFFQDATQEHTSSGIYSLLNDTWLKKPQNLNVTVDQKLVDNKVKSWKDMIDFFTVKLSGENKPSPEELETDMFKLQQFRQKIVSIRSQSLKKDGEFGLENLVYKELRNQGYVDKLFQTITRCYDLKFVQ